MTLQLVCADDVPPTAWRNGGGRTRELLARPAGDDWALRVSLADIEADGPFSAFAGVCRWFAVVTGDGVVLQLPDGERTLRPGDAPLAFDGAAAPGCRLLGGPTRDLNLMLRRGSATMRGVQPGLPWSEPFAERGLFTLSGGRWRDAGGQAVDLPPRSLLWHRSPLACRFEPETAAGHPCGWWLGFSPEDDE